MPDLKTDIVGQVQRLPLRPSAENALLPLYEAISNSLHGIQELYGDDNAAIEGKISIDIIRGDSDEGRPPIEGFRITDNGIGFTHANYEAFCTPFTRAKFERGGKGVGRLGWLKVFDTISVKSSYTEDKTLSHRAFNFYLRDKEQVEELLH